MADVYEILSPRRQGFICPVYLMPWLPLQDSELDPEINTLRLRQNGPTFSRRHFQLHSLV